MSYSFEISDKLKKALDKLAQKDKELAIAVKNKIQQIINSNDTSIKRFKNLRGNMCDFKRVHIGSFVLIFIVKGDTIFFEDFEHHDKIYKS